MIKISWASLTRKLVSVFFLVIPYMVMHIEYIIREPS